MLQEINSSEPETRTGARLQSSCFACGPDNSRGLHLDFQVNEDGEAITEWVPDPNLEGFAGIVHGGIISTVLDEAMSKVVVATGAQALTAELRVHFRHKVSSGRMVRVRGWIDIRHKRMIKTQAGITSSDGIELAHAWAVFLPLK